MYNLNTNYNLGNDNILILPTWKLARFTSDDWEGKRVLVSVALSTATSTNNEVFIGEYDYSEKGTFEDVDLFNFVLQHPAFSSSTKIEE